MKYKLCLLFIPIYQIGHSQLDKNNFNNNLIEEAIYQENKGQIEDQYHNVRNDINCFYSNKGFNVYLKSNGISYQINKVKTSIENNQNNQKRDFNYYLENEVLEHNIEINSYRVDIEWLGCNPSVKPNYHGQSDDYTNYYLTPCPDGALKVKNYKEVLYKSIYNGVDLKFYSKNGLPEYDYIVKPSGNYKSIKFKVNGAKKILINKEGELEIITPEGNIKQAKPLIIQGKKRVYGNWLINNNTISYEITNIDFSKEFIIDPLIRYWGTHCGGAGYEYGIVVETDSLENVYIAGTTNSPSTSFIATSGSFQNTLMGSWDGYIVKYNSNGVRLWGTYYGNMGTDNIGNAASCKPMKIDKLSNIYVTGATSSSVGMATANAHQTFYAGGDGDIYVAKFNSGGFRMWSTYLGGNKSEGGSSCDLDTLGNLYIVGRTLSDTASNFITAGAHKVVYSGGYYGDAFLVKIDTSGVLKWGTYYGGTNNDYGFAVKVDLNADVYIGGATSSSSPLNCHATAGSHQPVFPGFNCGYLAKFNQYGVRLWGTYYGGTGGTMVNDFAIDNSNNVFFSGMTTCDNTGLISTPGSHQVACGGQNDAFLVKFNTNGVRIWGTYYGAYDWERGDCILFDKLNNHIYLTGSSNSNTSTDTIATIGSYQYTFEGGGSPSFGYVNDAYLVKFDTNGVRKWGTYYGGFGMDEGYSIVNSRKGYLYLTGRSTTSYTNQVIATYSSQQFSTGGSSDAFLVKFFDCAPQLDVTVPSISGGCFGQTNGSVTLNVAGGGGYTYTWMPSGGNNNYATNLVTGIYTCQINSICGSTTKTISIVQPTSAISVSVATSNTLTCTGNSVTLNASFSGGQGPYIYNWSNGATTNSIVVSPVNNTIYTFYVTDANKCVAAFTQLQSVQNCAVLNENKLINHITLFPNPVNDKIKIKYDETIKLSRILIFDASGKLILENSNKSNLFQEIDLTNVKKGLYLVKLETEDKHYLIEKFIKE